jgi:hypothetical protein
VRWSGCWRIYNFHQMSILLRVVGVGAAAAATAAVWSACLAATAAATAAAAGPGQRSRTLQRLLVLFLLRPLASTSRRRPIQKFDCRRHGGGAVMTVSFVVLLSLSFSLFLSLSLSRGSYALFLTHKEKQR